MGSFSNLFFTKLNPVDSVVSRFLRSQSGLKTYNNIYLYFKCHAPSVRRALAPLGHKFKIFIKKRKNVRDF